MPVDTERHARHILLKEIGGPGQQKLARASVLIVGAGGLGSPAALYLAAAGIGRLRIVDPDTVSLDNLQRQILFRSSDVGEAKVERAAETLTDLDPEVTVEPVRGLADERSLPVLLDGMDLVLDGCDDFATRLQVNAAAVEAGRALVSGAVGRWAGQAGVFAPHLGHGLACYQCLVPEIPPGAERCAEVGIVGALTGVIGSLMALEAIKLVTGAGTPLLGRLHIQDTLAGETRVVRVAKDPACPVCGDAHEREGGSSLPAR